MKANRLFVFLLLLLLVALPAHAAAVLSVDALVSALIWLVVVGLLMWLAWWVLSQIPLPSSRASSLR